MKKKIIAILITIILIVVIVITAIKLIDTKDNNNDLTQVRLAEVILPQFPDSALNDIITIIDNYKKYDSWLSTPYITESSFNNLQDMLIDNNLLDDYIPYSDLLHNLYE